MEVLPFLAGLLLGAAATYLLLGLRYRLLLRSLSRSFDVKKGKIVEQLAPYLRSFPYDPHDARFLGSPVDFVVFDGLNSGGEVTIRFVEVKSGKSALGESERRVRDAVEKKRVSFEVFRPQ
ncbi:TPA: hypothetical protein EYP13_00100 [Candidatus Micrarchaeota archaeon]|nr:hypothetical protein [Candidatus Micrarchaeota archaeon]